MRYRLDQQQHRGGDSEHDRDTGESPRAPRRQDHEPEDRDPEDAEQGTPHVAALQGGVDQETRELPGQQDRRGMLSQSQKRGRSHTRKLAATSVGLR